jgi:hypothetical protein
MPKVKHNGTDLEGAEHTGGKAFGACAACHQGGAFFSKCEDLEPDLGQDTVRLGGEVNEEFHRGRETVLGVGLDFGAGVCAVTI